jgi:uncharacterized protein (TIGR02145 family)
LLKINLKILKNQKSKVLHAFLFLIIVVYLTGCKKDDAQITVTDIDGNTYNTVTIGSQIWMKENLRVTHYNDGTVIPRCFSSSEWENETQGAYVLFSHSFDAKMLAQYGALYNWYAVHDSRNLAPVGWHVPTDAEWATLITYLGGESIAGNKLKETGTTHWLSPNTSATNETGFTALPGGAWYADGAAGNLGGIGFWWSATEIDATYAWTRRMSIDSKVLRSNYYKRSGFSVRCVKD